MRRGTRMTACYSGSRAASMSTTWICCVSAHFGLVTRRHAGGELVVALPVGFVKAGDRYQKYPGRRVQETIKLEFDKVEELGSGRQALCWLRVQPRSAGEADQRRHCLTATELAAIYRIIERTRSTAARMVRRLWRRDTVPRA